MTILTEGQESFYLTVPAAVLDTSRDMASWASKHVVENANYKWILARYGFMAYLLQKVTRPISSTVTAVIDVLTGVCMMMKLLT